MNNILVPLQLDLPIIGKVISNNISERPRVESCMQFKALLLFYAFQEIPFMLKLLTLNLVLVHFVINVLTIEEALVILKLSPHRGSVSAEIYWIC